MIRLVAILAMSLLATGASRAQSTSDEVRLRATVQAVVPLTSFSGMVTPVDIDPRFALTVRIESAVPDVTSFSEGTVVTFAIHSPSLVFGGTATNGKTYDFSVQRNIENRKMRFFGLEVRKVQIAPVAAKFSNRVDSRPLAFELIIKADRKVYRMSDTLQLETQLRNVGKEDVYIWEWDMCWNMGRGLSMWIIGADGKEVESPFLLDCVPPPPHEADPYQFVKLAPGTFYGHAEGFKISERVYKPGEYDLDVTFKGSLSSEWVSEFLGNEPISKLPLWTVDHPTVSSNRIHFTVKP